MGSQNWKSEHWTAEAWRPPKPTTPRSYIWQKIWENLDLDILAIHLQSIHKMLIIYCLVLLSLSLDYYYYVLVLIRIPTTSTSFLCVKIILSFGESTNVSPFRKPSSKSNLSSAPQSFAIRHPFCILLCPCISVCLLLISQFIILHISSHIY